MTAIARAFRFRLVPAVLTALGVGLLANGIMTFTTAVEPAPTDIAVATWEPLPSIPATVVLPDAFGRDPVTSFPPDRVATRVVIKRLHIDLPIMLQTDNYGIYPLCDVALYQPLLGQPGQGRATYLYAHAQTGMFLPLLEESQRDNGSRMLGMTVEVYTSDDWRFVYTIAEVHRHTRTLEAAVRTTTERLWLQTSEGVGGDTPKLQVVADFLSAEKADPRDAHPPAHPRICGNIQ